MGKRKRGFSILELIIVLIIAGILVSISLPLFSRTKERALDKEAQANLRLIQAAERIYQWEVGFYYPYSGTVSDVNTINQFLKLVLQAGNWAYNVSFTLTGTATATRGTRTWNVDSTTDPWCIGAGCP